jgi:hypothetical protein
MVQYFTKKDKWFLLMGVQLFFRGAFFASQKTGLSAPIPRPCSASPAGFPLQSLARPRGFRVRGFDSWNFAPKK